MVHILYNAAKTLFVNTTFSRVSLQVECSCNKVIFHRITSYSRTTTTSTTTTHVPTHHHPNPQYHLQNPQISSFPRPNPVYYSPTNMNHLPLHPNPAPKPPSHHDQKKSINTCMHTCTHARTPKNSPPTTPSRSHRSPMARSLARQSAGRPSTQRYRKYQM
ncbi:hypothetical protein BDV95DRAFT_188913 [Massariosphaeria phaeospora]|uniref:Uncharacterized protein n=1 Tax=Massariosphaeria phaeospora TaxID=100035 RepID=A0A7C8I3U6_9PLEO|nr:hypothetical protein BDV95DRAFT_188913 [Massariosphaeria phaeospora]